MGPTFAALLVDDEPSANQGLRKLLLEHPHIQVVGAVNSVAEAILFLQQMPRLEVVFLDMEMPSGHGLELLPALHPAIHVVFVTASEAYARRAFDVGAIDYLVKPICPERLQDTVQRLTSRSALSDFEDAANEDEAASPLKGKPSPAKDATDTITIILSNPKRGVTQVIDIEQILWIESLQNYTKIYLREQTAGILLKRPIGLWEESLPTTHFSRLGRSIIVAIQQICSTEWRSREETLVYFRDSMAILAISRASATKLKKVLRQRNEAPI